MIQDEDSVSEYAYILRDYLQEQSEANLNRLSDFVRKLVARWVCGKGSYTMSQFDR